MSFIRFSNMVINPAWIQAIEIMPNNYKIVMSRQSMRGWIIGGSGWTGSENKSVWINKETEPKDYEIMTKWMDKNSS